jgi:nitrate reductase NapD
MTETEYHVASFVVYTRPEFGAEVEGSINALPGMEVHARENGKLVVTAEGERLNQLADLISTLNTVEGVVTVAPVYHEVATGDTTAGHTPFETTDKPGSKQS